MYLTSRVIMGMFRIAAAEGVPIARDLSFEQVYPVWASVVWALVMWQFEYHPDKLQASLTQSMKYLYHETNAAPNGASDFLPSPATAAVFCYVTLRAREELAKKAAKN
jgi:peroxisomal membrane protein 4